MSQAFQRVYLQFDLSDPAVKSLNGAVYGALSQNFLNAASQGMAIGLRFDSAPEVALMAERPVFTAELFTACPIGQKDKSVHYLFAEEMASLLWEMALTSQAINQIRPKAIDHSDYLDYYLPRFNLHGFTALQKSFAHQFNLPNKESFIRYGDFRYRHHDMRLLYGEHRPDRFQLQIDLGACPESWTGDVLASVFRSLLSANHLGFESSGLVWGVNPLNDHIILSADYSIWSSEQGLMPVDENVLFGYVQGLVDQCEGFWDDVLIKASKVGGVAIAQMASVAQIHQYSGETV